MIVKNCETGLARRLYDRHRTPRAQEAIEMISTADELAFLLISFGSDKRKGNPKSN